MNQGKQAEWFKQWELFENDELFLFSDWIFPFSLEDFNDKTVLECGCGGGQHTTLIAPYAKTVTSIDLNTIDIAKKKNEHIDNVTFIESDIATMDLGTKFDFVISIGVVHHTDDPDKTISNLIKHVKPGGKLIIWVYSKEGNLFMRYFLEPFRKVFLLNISKNTLLRLAQILTVLMYIPIYTVYLLPIIFLPYYHYFTNFRKLSFNRNVLNAFDKLNAPQVNFISLDRVQLWMQNNEFENIHISHYKKVSWRISGKRI